MGKKGKKGKQAKSREKGKNISVPYQEGVLAYLIKNKEKQLEDVKYEMKLLEDQNARHKERNEALLAYQESLVEHLFKSSITMSKAVETDVKSVTKEQVADKVYENCDLIQSQRKDISAMQLQIAHKEREITKVFHELSNWIEYKQRGADEERKQISLLQQEISDMTEQFKNMSEILERTLKNSSVETEALVNRQLDQQRYIATRNAVARMDKHSRQEVIDHDWLMSERALHLMEIESLAKEVEKLERENLELMDHLQRYQTENLFISRSRMLEQIEVDSFNDSASTCCEIDLSKINFTNKFGLGTSEPLSKTSVLNVIQQKLSALNSFQRIQTSEKEKLGSTFLSSLHKADDDFHLPALVVPGSKEARGQEDYLKLGPLELRLLGVSGERASLHTPQAQTEEEQDAAFIRSSDWPVTHSMLVDRLSRARAHR